VSRSRRTISARIRLAPLAAAIRDLSPTDRAARAALSARVTELTALVPERAARAGVSLRLVAEALRGDRDKGERQPALHEAAAALVDTVARVLAARRPVERIALLEQPERRVLALLRDLPADAPLLAPRASDFDPSLRAERGADTPRRDAGTLALPADLDRDLLRDFVQEAREHLEAAEEALLAIEENAEDAEAARTVLRAFHSIKGSAGLLQLPPIVDLAHHAESLVEHLVRRGDDLTGARVALALRAADALSALVAAVHRALESGAPIALPRDHAALLEQLRAASPGAAEPGPRAERPDAPPEEAAPSAAAFAAGRGAETDATMRVRTARIDHLVDLVGELVTAHWMIAQEADAARAERPEVPRLVAHAGKIVRELHDVSMGLRMVPLRGIGRRLARIARDLAARTGKPLHFELEGDGTELDRTMVELLADPLVHLLRNAIDHGIEPPDERRATGKPAAGTIRLAAAQSGGQVILELSDDGRGLAREQVLARAIARGLAQPGDPVDDESLLRMIVSPGFSTAERVTELSGRGMGMDVVHRNVRALRGRLSLASRDGAGVTFTLRVPLTLAVTDGMLVTVGPERYIVPTSNIVLSFRPERSALATVAGRGEVARLRDALLPIVRLHERFAVDGGEADPARALLIVVSAGDQRAALLVDGILGQHQVVSRSVGDGIGAVPGIAGSAILGDGRVGLILDVGELLRPVHRAPFAGAAVA